MSSRYAQLVRSGLLAASVFVSIASGTAQAAADPATAGLRFGVDRPFSVSDLPPGQLKRRLESLPPAASARAVSWLNGISFTGTDLDVLRVDDEGGVYFADSHLPDPALAPKGAIAKAAPATTLADAFLLHSRPGASKRVYLDFNGHTFTNTAWGSGTFVGVAYDLDSNPGNFNDTERGRIVDIWHRVSEDLAPFDIDVTTEEPASFNSQTGRILITRDTDGNGVAMPSQGAGGVAYVNVFGLSNYHTYYSPALVYFNRLGSGGETYVAEASSHEFGHNLGLSHDGTLSGTTYYGGHGSGLVSWAPIMGNSYSNNITEWSIGEYTDANQQQDDIAIITNKLGLRGDDHGNTIGSGTALLVGGDGTVVATNPETDPHNTATENKGVIGSRSDVDVFTFVAGGGDLNLSVRPAYDAFYRASDRRGANLDVRAELRDVGGALVASSDPTNDTQATVAATLAAGTYHLLVIGIDNPTVPYSDYNSMGQYFIEGTMGVANPDTNAPTPNPMTWASVPTTVDHTSITMTATTATDDLTTVQYRFTCVSGGAGCVTSAWQTSPTYTATGLAASTNYVYTVSARDLAANTTGASPQAGATTLAPPPPPPFVDYLATSDGVVSGSVSGTYANTHTDNGSQQSITEVDSGGQPAKRYSQLEHRWTFTLGGAGVSTTIVANAWSSGSGDGDTFNVQYSLNGGGSWTTAFNVSSTSTSNQQSYVLPSNPTGSVLIRVLDTNRVAGAREYNTFFVDHLYVRVANPSTEPPDGGPTGLSASAFSSSRIDLAWTDGASNESNYLVERSPNGSSGWATVANLAANSTSYSDTGLAANTTYFYRVSAYNSNGSSAYASADATTPTAPPPPAIALSASGYKSKGVAYISLTWTGATSVDVYRNNAKVASAVSGTSYTDNTGSKSAATYTHKVCLVGSTTSCSNTTTTVF